MMRKNASQGGVTARPNASLEGPVSAGKWTPGPWAGAIIGAVAAPTYVVALCTLPMWAPRWAALAIPLLIIACIAAVAGWVVGKEMRRAALSKAEGA